jgi:Cd2+/Zn2+-exporting ATPase
MRSDSEGIRIVTSAEPSAQALQAGVPWVERFRRLWLGHGEVVTTALCALFVGSGWVADRAGVPRAVSVGLFLTGYLLGGYRKAIEGTVTLLKDKALDVDLLMVVAAAGAAAIGYWEDGALLIFIFALSGTLEGIASASTKKDISALMALAPDQASVLRCGREERIAAADVLLGDRVRVRPGERIPADGLVFEGSSPVNQASITGESVPVDKRVGDEVFAGTMNGQGGIVIEVTRSGGDTVLARIVALVRDAEARRPPAQLFIERFERGYAKVVVLGALAATFVPWLARWWTFRDCLYRAMIFLVVASPCALAAAMMPALLSALSNGARHGVLFKGSVFVELLGRINAVAFDKTGTLTRGHPVVTNVVPAPGHSVDDLLARAAAVESLADYPLGRAVIAEAHRWELVLPPARDLQTIVSVGAHAEVAGQRWHVGKASLFSSVSAALLEEQHRLEGTGKTVIFVGDTEARGLIALRDSVRVESGPMVARLKALGVKHVVSLSGDNRATAESAAAECGIAEVHAQLFPEDKVRIVRELVARYGRVAMVGDGINDAPALAAASVGVAMGRVGTDVALEAADVVLTTDDVSKIPYAIALGRKALRIIKQNIAIALLVMVGLVISDFLRLVSLPWGVVGHEGSTLLVTLNGLRLLRGLRSTSSRGPSRAARPSKS